MSDTCDFPDILPFFDPNRGLKTLPFYAQQIKQSLKFIIPNYIFSGEMTREEQFALFRQALPLFTWTQLPKQAPGEMSFYLLCRLRNDAFRFFYDMVSRWLIPGQQVTIPLLYAADFSFKELEGEVFTFVEIIVRVENSTELETLKRNLWIAEAEIQIGADSQYLANRILEVKGLSGDEKTVLIHENLASLRKRRKEFGTDIFLEMQHFLVVCGEDFKQSHDHRYMSRLIALLYFFRKTLGESLQDSPGKRYIFSKLIRARLRQGKKVLGCLVVLNFLEENEVFEEKHLLHAIQSIVPHAEDVQGSFFSYQSKLGGNCALYLEVEPKEGTEFRAEDFSSLRKELNNELHTRIEKLMHAVFNPRNEEEVIKNILTLKEELQYTQDLPQVIISFDEQSSSHLTYTVVVLRLLKPEMQPIRDLFYQADTLLDFSLDREKVVGYLRKRYPKEATVFRVRIRKESFLRKNRAVDIILARQTVVKELEAILGDFRDFNGGMISKQNEVLLACKALCKPFLKGKEYLLETLFYSIPDMARSTIPAKCLQVLFEKHLALLQQNIQKKTQFIDGQELRYFYFVLGGPDESHRIGLNEILQESGLSSSQLVCGSHQYQGQFFDLAFCPVSEEEKWRDLLQKISLLVS